MEENETFPQRSQRISWTIHHHILSSRIHKAVFLLRVRMRREHDSHCQSTSRHQCDVVRFLNDDGTTAFTCGPVTHVYVVLAYIAQYARP